MATANQVINYLFIIFIMFLAADLMFQISGTRRLQAMYRRLIGRIANFFLHHLTFAIRWVWQRFHQYILGIASGILLVLYYQGFFP
jgi:hypothetical protein